MIEPQHPALSVSRQCALIGISRSAWYGLRKEESSLNLALMKLIDALEDNDDVQKVYHNGAIPEEAYE